MAWFEAGIPTTRSLTAANFVSPLATPRRGKNVLGVHGRASSYGRFIDVGLYRRYSVAEIAALLEKGPP